MSPTTAKMSEVHEYVDGRWGPPGDFEPQAVVTFTTEPSPETGHEGWVWWALGDMGEAPSLEAAKAAAERSLAKWK